MNDIAAGTTTNSDRALNDLIDEFALKMQAGEPIDLEACAVAHPELAGRLRRLIPAMQALADLGDSVPQSSPPAGPANDEPPSGVLGDYRIFAELGRGGMGVVYEAEQISLGRRVALKVLPIAALLDARQLARFKNEVRAAALLEHSHIIPVYAVGEDRGVHYFAMRLVRGTTLADWRAGGPGPASLRGEPHADTVLDRPANSPTLPPLPELERIRLAASLAQQAAEALEHAHQNGVIHRDIKPSNLLVDSQCHLWVADFGLAHVQGGINPTLTGDLLGTLRYMSPEQVQGRRGAVDYRTDIYSLGATLYELATLQPAVGGQNRGAIVRQILEDEPASPRRLNPLVPADMETIVLKCLMKNPAERYATAGAMAEDLGRFLNGETVLARRPSWLDRAVKWSQRRRGVLVATIAGLLLSTLVSSLAAVLVWRQNLQTATALRSANLKTREAEFLSARLALERALAMCHDGDVARGLVWLAYALELCPGDEADYQRAIRANIDAWSRLVHPLEMVLEHPGPVHSATFTPDGKRLLTSCQDGLIRVWDPADGTLLHAFSVDDPPQGAPEVAVHPRGEWVAVGDWSGRLHVLEIDGGRPVIPARQHSTAVGAQKHLAHVVFSPDGEFIFCCSRNGKAHFWPTRGGPAQGKHMLHTQRVVAFGFAPDGQTALTGTFDRTFEGAILKWQVPGGEPLGSLVKLPDDVAHGFAWQDEGRRLIVAGENFGASVWNLDAESLAPRRFPHLGRVNAVDASEEHGLVATGSADRSARIWQWPAATQRGAWLDHAAEVVSVDLQPGGRLLATAAGQEARLWRLIAPDLPAPTIAGLDGASHALELSANGRDVLAVGSDGHVHAWHSSSGEHAATYVESGSTFALSRDGARLICLLGGEAIGIRLDQSKPAWRLRGEGVFKHPPLISPSGETTLLFDGMQGVLVESSSGRVALRLLGAPANGACAAFSRDEGLIATGSTNNAIQLWDGRTGRPLGRPLPHNDDLGDAVFSLDGSLLWVGTKNGEICCWDVSTQQPRRLPTQLPTAFREMSFHPDGRWALGVAGDGSAQFFDAATGVRIGPPLLHYGRVKDPAYSGDGELIVTRGPGKQIRQWRVPENVEGTAADIKAGIEVLTGLSLGRDEAIVHLNAAEWRTRRNGRPGGVPTNFTSPIVNQK